MVTKYYEDMKKLGEEYQDFICIELLKRGMIIQNMTSKKYQYEHGENLSGIEIKYDQQLEKTGNIYIEISEKTDPQILDFTPSGIYRGDSWLYGIGNRNIFFLFSINYLKELHERFKIEYPGMFKEINTSQGFIIPIDEAREYAEKFYEFKEG